MDIVRRILRTASVILILLGIFAIFLPVVGFFVGLPILLIGSAIFSKTKEEKLSIEKNIEGSLPILKPIIKSKNYLILLITLSFAFFVFGPRTLRLFSAGLIVLSFILYNIAKHEEYKQTGKKAKLHLSDKQRKMVIVAATFFVILGFFYLTFMSLMADVGWKEPILIDKIGLLIITAFYAFPGALVIALSFWAIRYTYRHKDISNKFTVIEPGQIVISKESIKNRTLKESSN